MVGNGRGNHEEQNPTGGVTQIWRNHGESSRRFREPSTLRSVTFRSFSGSKDGMDTLLISQASNRYQARPVRWPETGELVGSSRGFGLGRVGSNGSKTLSLVPSLSFFVNP
ncbi:hypothetical protein CUMW_211420 [Citrus unshiu]|uniref:Uncharacterized protein n=1 Tax=Citrus unshiu TaxID=55188 RepID=A0A2H5QAN8_CITUN|nr:hypothetical protein CUMW_211420 [Citrus unshiu]